MKTTKKELEAEVKRLNENLAEHVGARTALGRACDALEADMKVVVETSEKKSELIESLNEQNEELRVDLLEALELQKTLAKKHVGFVFFGRTFVLSVVPTFLTKKALEFNQKYY